MTQTDAHHNRGVASAALLLLAALLLAFSAGDAEADKGGKATPKLAVRPRNCSERSSVLRTSGRSSRTVSSRCPGPRRGFIAASNSAARGPAT